MILSGVFLEIQYLYKPEIDENLRRLGVVLIKRFG